MPAFNGSCFRSKFQPFCKENLRFKERCPVWPEKVSFSRWQNFLKSYQRKVAKDHSYSIRSRRSKCGPSRFRNLKKLQARKKLLQKQVEVTEQLKALKPTCDKEVKLELVTMLKKFLDTRHVRDQIEKTIPDYRNQSAITYSKQSIMLSALAIFLYRMGSGHKFDDKSHDKDEKYSTKNMAHFIDVSEGRVPVIKTIEDFLKNLDEQSVNDLMIAFFKDLITSKFFQQHPQILPGDFFLLAVDCVHTHTYSHPHHMDKEGKNDCDYCLKRVYNKGTDHEKVRWIHATLVYTFVFMGSLKIPVYRHSIRAKQLTGFEHVSECDHKQECELVALKTSLPTIRQVFPRMKIVLLLDGLYANRPVIRLAEEHRCEYIIVRKEASLPQLAKECDKQAEHPLHKKNCTKTSRHIDVNGWSVERKSVWFNSRYLGEDVYTNVLRFQETRIKEGEETEVYQCEWLLSWKLSAATCETAALQARLRWEEEDLFNTLKNRDFNLRHDYSRDPRSCFNWHGMALFAFGIFELFRFSEVVRQRGDWPQTTLAEKLLGQLLHRPTEELFSEKHLSKRVQFRYHFPVTLKVGNKVAQNRCISVSRTDQTVRSP